MPLITQPYPVVAAPDPARPHRVYGTLLVSGGPLRRLRYAILDRATLEVLRTGWTSDTGEYEVIGLPHTLPDERLLVIALDDQGVADPAVADRVTATGDAG